MNKKGILIVLFAAMAGMVLSGCQQQKLMRTDLFGTQKGGLMASSSPEPITPLAPTLASVAIYKEDLARAGILARKDDSLNLLKKIGSPQEYDLVVLISPTAYRAREGNIFTYENEGVLSEKSMIFESGMLGELLASKTAVSLGDVPAASAWNTAQTAALAAKFLGAKFVLISISSVAEDQEVSLLAEFLANNLTEKSLVLALADFEKNGSENLNLFIQQFENTVLMLCDTGKFDELPEGNTKALEVLARFIGHNGKCSYLAKDWNGETLQALYGFEGVTPALADANSFPVYFTSLGDIMLGRYVRTLMNINGLNYPFAKTDVNFLKTNDFLLGNLEGPIAINAVKTSKTIAFRFMPDTADLLKANYFDVIDLANNHAYDMGVQGYEDTKTLLSQKGLLYFGDTRGINENSVARMEIRGHKIAFLGLEEVTAKINDDEAVKTIRLLSEEGYSVIAVPHWGVEYTHRPNARQTDLAHKFIDAGAVMVIAHHPHVVQAFEDYKGHPVFYSLGNAVFDQYFSADTQEGLAISVALHGDSIEVFLIPLKIEKSQLMLMEGSARDQFLERFAGYGTHDENMKAKILEGRISFQLR